MTAVCRLEALEQPIYTLTGNTCNLPNNPTCLRKRFASIITFGIIVGSLIKTQI